MHLTRSRGEPGLRGRAVCDHREVEGSDTSAIDSYCEGERALLFLDDRLTDPEILRTRRVW